MKNLTKSIPAIISSLIVLVIGILCIVVGASGNRVSDGAYEGISLTIGITLLIISSLVLILALVASIMSKGETSFRTPAIGVSIVLALGIFFVANQKTAGGLIGLFLDFIPFVLVVVGSIIIADAILVLIFGALKKNIKVAAVGAIVTILVGAIAVLLGALMIGNDPVISKDAQWIFFGILLVVYALLFCAATLIVLIASKKEQKEDEKKDSIDAQVVEVKPTEETEAKTEE